MTFRCPNHPDQEGDCNRWNDCIILRLDAEVERLREIKDDARDGQNILQARIDRALELLSCAEACRVHAENRNGEFSPREVDDIIRPIRAALTGEDPSE